MVYDAAHYYVTFGGGLLVGGTEKWQTGFRCRPDNGNLNNSEATLLSQLHNSISVSDILADVTAVIKNNAHPFPGPTTVNWAKVAVINAEGDYAGDAVLQEQAPQGGGGGTQAGWPQLATCVSLWSGSNFGRANRGRMYWPCMASLSPDNATGQAGPKSYFDTLATSITNMIDAINGEVSTVLVGTTPSIMSKIGAGESRPIERVGVGYVVDTIRSRREALDDVVKNWKTTPYTRESALRTDG